MVVLGLPASGAAMGRVTLHSGDPDHLRVRQRLERALATVDWMPPGLAPRSILVVRRLTASAARSTGRASFAGGLSTELQRCARLARRPRLDPDAASADAVIFADEAELVACLLRDWMRGVVADRWWWQQVLASQTTMQWLRRHVIPRGDVLAPALGLLEPPGELAPCIARLDEADARVAVAAVARAFAFSAAATSSASTGAAEQRDGPAAEPPFIAGVPTSSARAAAARLIATVPEARSSQLSGEQRRLLVLVLVAVRAPSWGRMPEFAAAMGILDRLALAADSGAPGPAANDAFAPAAVDQPLQDRPAVPASSGTSGGRVPTLSAAETARTIASSTARGDRPDPVAAQTIDASSDPPPQAAPGRSARVAAATPSATPPPVTAADEGAPGPIGPPVLEEPEHRRESPPPVATRRPPDAAPEGHATPIPTAYGGIFYLLNAWIAMGVYADFTAPRGTNFPLSPWNLLALVGREWFGESFVADGVWSALADLAVRAPEEEPDRDVELPAGWLERHLEDLAAALTRALGAERSVDVPGLVCRHRAAIELTASRVQVHLDLCALPLEVRIAGLDRDPGWIPAAGRAVYFHFM